MQKMTIVGLLVAAAASAAAQMSPDKTYCGVNGEVPVTIKGPAGATSSLKVLLLEPVTGRELARADAKPGKVDLAKLFPELWKTKEPKLSYAQLLSGDRRIGSAIVLQPMVNPSIAKLKTGTTDLEWVPDEDGKLYSGLRIWSDVHVVLETTFGEIELRMRPDVAPNTVWNFLELVKGGFYTNIPWHRVVAKNKRNGFPFVIQAGDPTGTGSGGPGYVFDLEDSSLPHDFGVISMARASDPNTNGSQIFICLSREGTQHLDHKYASFGEAVSGADAILKTGSVTVSGEFDRPIELPYIKRAVLKPAPPYGNGPPPIKRPPVK